MSETRVLVMTVGTGDVSRLEETLYTPLRKSIATGIWTKVVLLPSEATRKFAEVVRQRIQDLEVVVEPLHLGDEDDADRAYAHFDSVLAKLLRETSAESVEVDFTRGTKAMSAALVLAAARHGIPRLRYVAGRQRDERGTVVADSEVIRSIRTTIGTGHRLLDLACELMRRGNFLAAETALPGAENSAASIYPGEIMDIANAVQPVTRFYAAWDRLDYAAASAVNYGGPPDANWAKLWPTQNAKDWVRALAANDRDLRQLIADLLANGERRIQQGQHEDALVRAYRVLELIGQARLSSHGLDSSALDPEDRAVKNAQATFRTNGRSLLSKRPDGKLQASRIQVIGILKECGDREVAKRLRQFEYKATLNPTRRNTSLLIHGFEARAPGDPAELNRLFKELVQLARYAVDARKIDDWLEVARMPMFASG